MYLRFLNYAKFNFKLLCFFFYLVVELVAGNDGKNLNGENSTMTDAIKVTHQVALYTFQYNFLSIVRFYCSKNQLLVPTDVKGVNIILEDTRLIDPSSFLL